MIMTAEEIITVLLLFDATLEFPSPLLHSVHFYHQPLVSELVHVFELAPDSLMVLFLGHICFPLIRKQIWLGSGQPMISCKLH